MIEMVPKPKLIRRTGGGWLAISPKNARFKIGVVAETEGQAEDQFWRSYVRWCEIVPLEEGNPDVIADREIKLLKELAAKYGFKVSVNDEFPVN